MDIRLVYRVYVTHYDSKGPCDVYDECVATCRTHSEAEALAGRLKAKDQSATVWVQEREERAR